MQKLKVGVLVNFLFDRDHRCSCDFNCVWNYVDVNSEAKYTHLCLVLLHFSWAYAWQFYMLIICKSSPYIIKSGVWVCHISMCVNYHSNFLACRFLWLFVIVVTNTFFYLALLKVKTWHEDHWTMRSWMSMWRKYSMLFVVNCIFELQSFRRKERR